MKLTYLGTAAAEGLPAVWCNCETCITAREKGGKNIRTRSQILIDGDTLIDFPMDTYMHALKHKLDLSAVENVFITHAHMDHCYPQELVLHGAPYAHNMTRPILNVYGNSTVIETVRLHNKAELKESIAPSLRLKAIKPYDEIGCAGGLKVTALPAVHTKGEDCLIYVAERHNASVMLFNDSGILPDTVYDEMARLKIKLNLISFDCTYGNSRHGAGRHMGLPDNLDELEKMKKRGIADEKTLLVITHFSHNGGLQYEQMRELATGYGVICAYDGMIIEI